MEKYFEIIKWEEGNSEGKSTDIIRETHELGEHETKPNPSFGGIVFDEDAYNTYVNDIHNPANQPEVDASNLEHEKYLRLKMVDDKSRELIENGFSYGGKQMSLSIQAQANLAGFHNVKSIMTYPQGWTTLDDEEYSIPTEADFDSLYLTALSRKKTVLDEGRVIKVSIKEATNLSELDAIEDNRS